MENRKSPAEVGPGRILLVGQASFDSVIDSYHRALQPHYQIRILDPFAVFGKAGEAFGPVWAARLSRATMLLSNAFVREPLSVSWRRLLRMATEFVPDIVLITCIDLVPADIIEKLRKVAPGCKILGVFSDHIANFGRGYFFAADYDALFFKDRYIVDKFRSKLGWKHVYYLPQACDRILHDQVELTSEDLRFYGCDITLAGHPYLYRNEGLRPLLGMDLKIWGPPPPAWVSHPSARRFQGRYVAGIEKCKAMLASKIVLNQNHYAEIAGTNKRTFEVASIGAFQLTDTPGIRDVFDPDTEVAFYETRDEMLSKIDEFLRSPEERLRMAEKARKRARSEHTYEHRWVAHLLTLGLRPATAFPVQPEGLTVLAR